MNRSEFENRALGRLALLYGEGRARRVLQQLLELTQRHRALQPQGRGGPRWTEEDVLLITYGDSIQRPGAHPLRALKDFADRRLAGVCSMIHVLPFFPYSSDDGFAVSDFRAVNPELGTWEDIAALRQRFDLLFDLVLNHMSREHLWFVNYLRDEQPGRDYVIEVDPATNLSLVVRPRNTPLLSQVRTPRGLRHVWATFSNDQIDLNYANPDVLLAMLDILLEYVRCGARGIRLDAVGFLWKEPGTTCIHLPQTHEVVKLIRDLLDYLEPGVILLTETNVPHQENVTYFGVGDESHMVYQFNLPPLLLHAIHTGNTDYLTAWARQLDAEDWPAECSFLNFTASHDGVGLRPLEGIIPDAEVDRFIADMRSRGGFIAMRATSDGRDRPYELNISYYSAFADPEEVGEAGQIRRFLLSQTLPLALKGVPAVYLNALMATPNDSLSVERTGMTRSINRRKWDGKELEDLIDNPGTAAAQVFRECTRRLKLRRRLKAFHPQADQSLLDLPRGLFGVTRSSMDGAQRVLAIHNCSSAVKVVPGGCLAGFAGDDILNQPPVPLNRARLYLEPYQAVWLLASSSKTASSRP